MKKTAGYTPRKFWETYYQHHKTVGFVDKTYYRYEEILRAIAFRKAMKVRKGMKLLDIGCGEGTWCFRFARKGAKVVGTDINRLTIKKAKELNRKKGLNVKFYPVKAEDIKPKKGFFDAVYSITVLQHITKEKNYLKALDNIVASTKKGGKILILEMIDSGGSSEKYIKNRKKIYVVAQFRKRKCSLAKDIKIPKFGYAAILGFNALIRGILSLFMKRTLKKMKKTHSERYDLTASQEGRKTRFSFIVYEAIKKIILILSFPIDLVAVTFGLARRSSFRLLVFEKG